MKGYYYFDKEFFILNKSLSCFEEVRKRRFFDFLSHYTDLKIDMSSPEPSYFFFQGHKYIELKTYYYFDNYIIAIEKHWKVVH